MTEKNDSKSLPLATASILGQAPRSLLGKTGTTVINVSYNISLPLS